jgi:hypothetical protein
LLGIGIGVLKGRQKEVRNLFCTQVLEALSHALNGSILDFSFVIIKELSESLDEIAVGNLFSESVSKLCEVLCKGKSDLP